MDLIKKKISYLWIVVMFNMIFADILSFITPGFFEALASENTGELQITEELLLIFAVLLEIPIAMIFLSRFLDSKINSWLNIFASIIIIVFVVGGGSLYLHYIFFATIEIVSMLWIIRYSLLLKKQLSNP